MSWLGLLVGEFRVCIWVAVFGVLPVCTLGSACDTLLASMLLVSRECKNVFRPYNSRKHSPHTEKTRQPGSVAGVAAGCSCGRRVHCLELTPEAITALGHIFRASMAAYKNLGFGGLNLSF